MLTVKQKEIRQYDAREELHARLNAWQKANNTTGLPRPSELGLELVARSYGVYGANGSLFRDIETGELLGSPARDYFVFMY